MKNVVSSHPGPGVVNINHVHSSRFGCAGGRGRESFLRRPSVDSDPAPAKKTPDPFASVRWLSLFAAFLVCTAVQADKRLTDQSSVEAARDALGGFDGFPWYDDEQDGIRRLDVEPSADFSARKSKWEFRPVNWTWPEWLTYLLKAVMWLVLALAIIIVIFALLKAFGWAEFSARVGNDTGDDSLRGDIDRVEALPFQLQRPQADLLAEARRHYEAGEYEQAMIYLYSYQLVQLDRQHLIRLTKGKTNRQYLREVRPRRELWGVLRGSMIAFEDVFFGHHRLDRARFESCWNRLDEFHQQLEAVEV